MVDIKKTEESGIIILDVIGEVDASSSIQLDNAIRETIADGSKKIIIDCDNLDYISSAGLGVFMSYVEDLTEAGAEMILCGLNEKVENVFKILGLDQLLTTEKDRKAAIERLK